MALHQAIGRTFIFVSTFFCVLAYGDMNDRDLASDFKLELDLFKQGQIVGKLSNSALTEVSGIASSQINENVLWVLNDSGNSAALYAIDQMGRDLGDVHIAGTHNQDWEDLASFTLNNTSYLVVGDIGDNFGVREESILYFIKEPKLVGRRFSDNLMVSLVAKIRFRFEGGATDCLALAVNANDRKIYLIGKSQVPPTVYELPLFLGMTQSTTIYTARKSATLAGLPKSNYKAIIGSFGQSYFDNQPTALDMSENGLAAIVLTKSKLFYYQKQHHQNWSVVFDEQVPIGIPIDNLDDAEAAAFSIDGRSLFVTSEKKSAPLIRIDRIH
ncbi:MAG: hypothetical protein KUG82_00690 [Pseudomonadales bacterium]|nr:hypothetical protein [Pseudomonadales bacterium]